MSNSIFTSAEANKATVRRLFEECLNGNRPQLARELLAADFLNHTTGSRGVDAFETFNARFLAAFPDRRYTVEDLIGEGDRVAARWRLEGTHQGEWAGVAATGKGVVQTANVIFRLEDGRIAESWIQLDTLGFLRQLGALPEA
jgi:steroid delta-isomerase-like uncharacterized protein